VGGSVFAAHRIATRAMDPNGTTMPNPDGHLLTPGEVADRLRVTAEQVRCLIRTGQLAAVNVGAGTKRPCYRITPDAVAEFLARRAQPAPATRRPPPRRFAPVPDDFPNLK
jgi:excisionase family DNA binding protein